MSIGEILILLAFVELFYVLWSEGKHARARHEEMWALVKGMRDQQERLAQEAARRYWRTQGRE